VVKSRRKRWAGHVAGMGRGEVCTGIWWGNLKEGNHLGDPGVDGSIILISNFGKWGCVCLDGIELAQDRVTWRALVNAVMNLFQVP